MSNDNQRKTRDEWFALIEEQSSSGQSQTELCKERHLILHRFAYYKQQAQPQTKSVFTPVKVSHEP